MWVNSLVCVEEAGSNCGVELLETAAGNLVIEDFEIEMSVFSQTIRMKAAHCAARNIRRSIKEKNRKEGDVSSAVCVCRHDGCKP